MAKRDFRHDEWSQEVRKRDKYTCQKCGKKSKRNQAHHIDSYDWFISGRYDIRNGATLCWGCHNAFHKIYGKGRNDRSQYYEFLKRRIR